MASKVLQIHNSDSESSEESGQDDPPPTTRKRRELTWDKVEKFGSGSEAKNYVKNQKQWRLSSKMSTEAGDKVYYHCKVSRSCMAKVYILVKSDCLNAELFQTTTTHTHEPKPSWGMTEEIKAKVNQLYADGVTKPKIMLSRIRDAGLREPKKRTLDNYLSAYRKKTGMFQ